MKETVTKSMFRDGFVRMGRKDQFSYSALGALYDYLEELEDDTGEEIEFDVIGLCCEYSEYEDLDAFREDYGDEYETIEDVEERTTVIRIDWSSSDTDGAFLIQQF